MKDGDRNTNPWVDDAPTVRSFLSLASYPDIFIIYKLIGKSGCNLGWAKLISDTTHLCLGALWNCRDCPMSKIHDKWMLVAENSNNKSFLFVEILFLIVGAYADSLVRFLSEDHYIYIYIKKTKNIAMRPLRGVSPLLV